MAIVVPGPAPIAPAQLHINNFQNTNVLQTGQIQNVINHIQRPTYANDTDRLNELMNCLTQTFTHLGRYQVQCRSALRDRIFTLASQNPSAASRVVDQSFYRESLELSDVIARIEYLNSNRLFKWFHHIEKGVIRNKYSGIASITFGISLLLVGGMSRVLIDENPTAQNIGIATVVTGAGFIVAPFIYSFSKTFGEKP